MKRTDYKRGKAKAGLLLIASPRFKNLGEGLRRGTYSDRKKGDVEEITGSLKESLDLACPGIVYSREDAERAMDLFWMEKVDFVIAEFLSWSEDFAWIRFLRDMPEVPMIFVNPMKGKITFENSLDEDDFVDFLCSGTLVGSLEASGSIPRIGRKNVKIITGSRAEIMEKIIIFSKAARVRSILRQSTFGLLANYNELMWSTYVDPYNLFTRIGPEMKFISYSMLADEVAKVTDSETQAYKDELLSMYHMDDDVEEGKFIASVRASLGLARLFEQHGIDAMVFNDLHPTLFELVGLRPGFYHPSINSSLSVLVPEADTGTCLITFIMKLLSGKHVNFIEPFHVETDNNTFAAGHAGPNDHNDPDHRDHVRIARDVRFAKTNYKYAGAPFAWFRIPEGRKTMAHFSENNGSYKLVCTLVDANPGAHILASYSHGIFQPLIPVKEFFEKILNIGTTQHFALVDGDYRQELSLLARIMGFDFHSI
jgi:L-arabinose isomerase